MVERAVCRKDGTIIIALILSLGSKFCAYYAPFVDITETSLPEVVQCEEKRQKGRALSLTIYLLS